MSSVSISSCCTYPDICSITNRPAWNTSFETGEYKGGTPYEFTEREGKLSSNNFIRLLADTFQKRFRFHNSMQHTASKKQIIMYADKSITVVAADDFRVILQSWGCLYLESRSSDSMSSVVREWRFDRMISRRSLIVNNNLSFSSDGTEFQNVVKSVGKVVHSESWVQRARREESVGESVLHKSYYDHLFWNDQSLCELPDTTAGHILEILGFGCEVISYLGTELQLMSNQRRGMIDVHLNACEKKIDGKCFAAYILLEEWWQSSFLSHRIVQC